MGPPAILRAPKPIGAHPPDVYNVAGLSGRKCLPERSLPTLDRQTPLVDDRSGDGELRLLWIVDLARCPACFGVGLAIWNALAEDRSLRLHVFVAQVGALRGVLTSGVIRSQP